MAYHLHSHEPLVQERGAGSGLRAVATRADRAHPHRGREPGFHHRQSPSRRHRRVKKNGPQAIGKSRGGWTTKIHMVAADARTAITFALSPGQASDTIEGRKLLGWHRPLARALASDHGSRLRRQRNPATGTGLRFHSRGSTPAAASRALAV